MHLPPNWTAEFKTRSDRRGMSVKLSGPGCKSPVRSFKAAWKIYSESLQRHVRDVKDKLLEPCGMEGLFTSFISTGYDDIDYLVDILTNDTEYTQLFADHMKLSHEQMQMLQEQARVLSGEVDVEEVEVEE